MERRRLMGLGGAAALGLALPANASPLQRHPDRGAPRAVGTRGDVSLYIRRWGAGHPVLFVSGWTLPSDFWAYQMLALARAGCEVSAYDRRGHGRSADPGRGYEHDTLADDLAAVLNGIGRQGVTVIGHSMAAMEIARYFARHG